MRGRCSARLVALFVTGVSNAVLDVSGFTLVQRGVRNEDRVTMFGVMEGSFGVGLLVGSLAGPALVALLGARGSLVVAGAILPILALITWAADRETHAPIAARGGAAWPSFGRNPLFAPLPLTALDRLAESLVPVSYGESEVVMREGDPGDGYVLIEHGEVDVSADGRPLGTCGPGDGVGEIALLQRVPRTATVVARTHVEAYTIDSADFLAAVSGPAAAAAVETIVSRRLERSQ